MSALLIGMTLAVVVAAFARLVGLDRDRAFYPTVLVVVASYYDLFATMAGTTATLLSELAVTALFVAAVVLGFRRSLWFVAAALVAHGGFDAVHGTLIANPGVPAWWPAFCGGYDVAAGVLLAVLLTRGRPAAAPAS